MLEQTTLFALACLIANKGPIHTTSVEAQMAPEEQSEVHQIIESGACLPDQVENLIRRTHEARRSGLLRDSIDLALPTKECL